MSSTTSPSPVAESLSSKVQTASPKEATEKIETRENRSSSMSRRASGSRRRNSLVPFSEPIKSPYLYVSQLRPDAPIGKLIPLLQEKGGPIVANHFHENQTFGFVHFTSVDAAAAAAQALHGTTFHGHPIFLEPCERMTPGVELVRGHSNTVSPPASQPATVKSEKSSKKNSKAEESEAKSPEEKADKSNILFMRNFPAKTQEELLAFITEKGLSPVDLSLHFTTDGRANGFAFVKFATVDEATAAYSVLDKSPYGNRKIKVEWKKPSAQPTKSAGGEDSSNGNQAILDKLTAFSTSTETKLELSSIPKGQQRAIIDAATKLGFIHQIKGENQSKTLTISKPTPVAEQTGISSNTNTNTNTNTSSRPLVATITTTLMDGQVSITSHVVIKGNEGKQDATSSPSTTASVVTASPAAPAATMPAQQTSPAPPTKPQRLTESKPPQASYSPSRAPKGPDGTKGFAHFPRTNVVSA